MRHQEWRKSNSGLAEDADMSAGPNAKFEATGVKLLTKTWRHAIAAVIVAVSTVSLVTQADAFPRVPDVHPAGVPGDFVITPFGYFHPSCVGQLAHGDILHQETKTIERANKTTEKIPECAYPHYRADGERVIGDEKAVQDPDISHAWIENASTTQSGPYGFQYAFWDVPPGPTNQDGQTLFFFNGMEDINDVVTIIQPVLGWNSDYGNAWGIAAWNCCESGSVFEGTPVRVNSGDQIFGYMFDNCASGSKTCASWDIVAWDLTNRQFSDLVGTSNFGQTFNWAFGGVLEVYGIKQCGDFPNGPADGYRGGGPELNFYNQGLYTDRLAFINTPKWSMSTTSGLSPSCGYGGTVPQQVILTY